MSDNIGYTPGTGATIAADNVGGVLHQRVKLTAGADGTAVDVSPTNPLPTDTGPLEWLLRRLVDLLISPRGYDASANRMRQTAVIETGSLSAVGTVTTVTTVTTVAAVTALNGLGALPAEALARHQNIAAWSDCCRARIT